MSKEHFRNLATAGIFYPEIFQRQLPGRLTRQQTARLLGFQEDDIAVLIRHKMLVPLGKPKPNAPKYFATVYVLALANDPKWLGEATRIIYDHWKEKNNRKGDPDNAAGLVSEASFGA